MSAPLVFGKTHPVYLFDGKASKMHAGGFSLCVVKMCVLPTVKKEDNIFVCVLVMASRIPAILWENDTAALTGSVP